MQMRWCAVGLVWLMVSANAIAVRADGLCFEKRNTPVATSTFVDNSRASEKLILMDLELTDLTEEIEESMAYRFPIQYSRAAASDQSPRAPTRFLGWTQTQGPEGRGTEILLFRDTADEGLQVELLAMKRGQAPNQILYLRKAFYFGDNLLGLIDQHKIIVRTFRDNGELERKPIYIARLDLPATNCRIVPFDRSVSVFPFYFLRENGKVLFRRTFDWKDNKMILARDQYIDVDTAALISGDLWELNYELTSKKFCERNKQANMHVWILRGFSDDSFYYCNMTAGIILKANQDKFMFHTWFDLDDMDLVVPSKYPDDCVTHVGGFYSIHANPLTRDLWMLRVFVDEDGKYKFIRNDGRFFKEYQPTFDVLDENLQYKHSIRLRVPEQYKRFTILNFYCTSDDVMYLYAYTERADIKEKGTLFFRAKLTRNSSK